MDGDRGKDTPTLISGEGVKPRTLPPRVQEFYELERGTIDVLIDSSKYYVSTSGISLSVYAAWVQNIISAGLTFSQRFVLFLPIIAWFGSILAGVVAVYPKKYIADTDFKREQTVIKLRSTKLRWSLITLILFALGFAFAVYSFSAKIWDVFPFSSS